MFSVLTGCFVFKRPGSDIDQLNQPITSELLSAPPTAADITALSTAASVLVPAAVELHVLTRSPVSISSPGLFIKLVLIDFKRLYWYTH